MTILKEFLKEIETESNLTDRVRMLCDEIYKEQSNDQKYRQWEPIGPNTFLCLQIPGKTKRQTGYLTLEREAEDRYVCIFQTFNILDLQKVGEEPKITRQQTWEIGQSDPRKILIEYAKNYKFLRGE
ncbi:MAG: hypothetical protein ACTSX1_09490 [Candidatus Heimdallarchaeaceae archaeon]